MSLFLLSDSIASFVQIVFDQVQVFRYIYIADRMAVLERGVFHDKGVGFQVGGSNYLISLETFAEDFFDKA
jgi:hypothetical protein